jgi:ESS family glutamate:Na+ symporter
MTSTDISTVMEKTLRAFCLCGGLLLVGTFIRAKVRIFQNLYIPACVIGGLLGLILSPTVMGKYAVIPVSDNMNTILGQIAPLLFMMIMASLPMCAAPLSRNTLKGKTDVWIIALLISLVFAAQFAIGFGVNVFFDKLGMPTYKLFGNELANGFTGGHGIVGMVASSMQALNDPNWKAACGVVVTTATVGILGGIIWGIILINIGARKGYTHYITDPADLPEEMRTGFYKSVEDQPNMGKETTSPSSIDSITFHMALILLVTGLGYLIDDAVRKYDVPILTDFSAWVYMLILMYIIWPIICKLHLDKHFNAETKSKITGTITDFIIVAAIISIPLEVVAEYWKQILTMCVLGLIFTPLLLWFFAKKYIRTDWIEKIMGPIGMNHGDFITGILLIKMVDPNMKSDAIEDFSLGYVIHNFYALAMFVFIFPYVEANGPGKGAIFCLINVLVIAALTIVFGKLFKRQKKES